MPQTESHQLLSFNGIVSHLVFKGSLWWNVCKIEIFYALWIYLRTFKYPAVIYSALLWIQWELAMSFRTRFTSSLICFSLELSSSSCNQCESGFLPLRPLVDVMIWNDPTLSNCRDSHGWRFWLALRVAIRHATSSDWSAGSPRVNIYWIPYFPQGWWPHHKLA